MPALTTALASTLVRRENWETYLDAQRRGKGIIVVLGHIGNFEMLAASQSLLGEPLHAIVKDFSWRPFNDFVAIVRQRTNYRTIPPKRSSAEIRARLAENASVAFLVDQHLSHRHAIVCEFFGQLAATTPAPTRFALETGAPILPAVTFRDPRSGYHVVRIEPEFHLEAPYDDPGKNLWHNTERLNRIIEGWIRSRPDNYFWVHRRWKVHDKPEGWNIPTELTHLLGR